MATLRPENVIKTIDNLGRITLPKGLRDRMYLDSENNQLEIFTMEVDGKMYICLASPETANSKLYATAAVLKEMGIAVPKELEDKIAETKNDKGRGKEI